MKNFILATLALTVPATLHASETTKYDYDPLGRLVKVKHEGGPANGVEASYNLDPAGNRTNVTVTGAGDRVIVVPLNGFTIIPLSAN